MTHKGLVREANEDMILTDPTGALWAVADGMGGHAAGDYASQKIAEESESVGVASSLPDLEARFMERLTRANTRILQHAAELGNGTIGSTVAALLVQQGHYASIWSGADGRQELVRNLEWARRPSQIRKCSHR